MPHTSALRDSLCAAALLLCANTLAAPADIIITNARIYTMDAAQPTAEALAIAGETILAVGSNSEVGALAGPATRRLDAGGNTMLPGFHDGHVHTQMAGIKALYECDFSPDLSPDAFTGALRECAGAAPAGKWITGGRWRENVFPDGRPDRDFLDAVVPDQPMVLVHESYHYTIANSAALEKAGITRDTPDPTDGSIERDTTGRATGVMREAAQGLIARVIPPPTAAQALQAVRWAAQELNRHGITSISAALTAEQELDAYRALAAEGELTVDVDAHLPWQVDFPGIPPFPAQQQLVDKRGQWTGPRIRTDGIKMFIDGVPMLHTAAMLEPYNDKAGVTGSTLHPQARLNTDVTALDARGLTVKMHAVGDAAARSVFEAVAAARAANGPDGPMHQMAHCNLVHADDLARFAELNVACELSPYFWAPGLGGPPLAHWHELLGEERTEHLWGAGEIAAAGALLMAGSDWPVVGDPDPWPAIEGLVTRADPAGKLPGHLGAQQRIDRWQAIAMYTTNPARALGLAGRRGRLAAGMDANLILVDRDVGSVPNSELGETVVLSTMLRGRFEFIRQR